MIAYRVGYPGWKIAAVLGIPLKALVEVLYDEESQVYVATCDDFLPSFGIATEAETIKKLKKRLDGLFEDAIYETFKKKKPLKVRPYLFLVQDFSPFNKKGYFFYFDK